MGTVRAVGSTLLCSLPRIVPVTQKSPAESSREGTVGKSSLLGLDSPPLTGSGPEGALQVLMSFYVLRRRNLDGKGVPGLLPPYVFSVVPSREDSVVPVDSLHSRSRSWVRVPW